MTDVFIINGVKSGDVVIVHFTSKISDETVFETSKDDEPLKIKIGEGKINQAFEEALLGMNPGEKKEVLLPADKAYGEYKKRLVLKMRKSGLNLKCDPKPGDIVAIKLPTGQSSLVKVIEMTSKSIKVDANHPMAGKDLKYELELLKIITDI